MNNIPLNEDLWKKISPREKEIAEDLAEGLTSVEIAQKRYISNATVEAHRHNMLKKTGFKNTVRMIVAMVRDRFLIEENNELHVEPKNNI